MKTPSETILLIGAFDTKGEEYAFVEKLLEARGHGILKMDIGVIGTPKISGIDYFAHDVAEHAGTSLAALRERKDRGQAMAFMARGAAELTRQLYERGRFAGVFGMGGTGSGSVISAAMQSLPVGVPKVLVSTAVSREITGMKDIALFPSIVDIAGLNRISRSIFTRAAGAISGMVEAKPEPDGGDKPIVAVTMFGNTTACADRCRERLTRLGYEVLVFHCTGAGGMTMESLVEDGLVQAVLDLTTTEWADELCGGIFSAGPNRLDAPGKKGIPHLIVPGCVDMVNFGPRSTVPEKYGGRDLYEWNPHVTLMRTTPEENAAMGKIFASKANRAEGPTSFLFPLQGYSELDSPGNPFWGPDADAAMLNAVESDLLPHVPLARMDAGINDPRFADRAVDMLLKLIERGK